jgi:hypothetical protein
MDRFSRGLPSGLTGLPAIRRHAGHRVDRQGRIVRIKYCGLALLLLVFPAFGQTPLGASRGVPAEKEISALINSKKSCVSVVPVVTSRAHSGDVIAER